MRSSRRSHPNSAASKRLVRIRSRWGLELEHVTAAGLTPMQALPAATSRAAECLGLEAEIGTIEKGKLADLVLVDGDPLKDIRVRQDKPRFKRVIKGGLTVIARE